MTGKKQNYSTSILLLPSFLSGEWFLDQKDKKQCEDGSKCKIGEENDCLKWVQVSKINEPPPWNRTCHCNHRTTADKFWGKTENCKGIQQWLNQIFQCSERIFSRKRIWEVKSKVGCRSFLKKCRLA